MRIKMFCHDIVFLQKDVLGIPYVIKNTYFFLKINKNAINQYKKCPKFKFRAFFRNSGQNLGQKLIPKKCGNIKSSEFIKN